MWLGGAIPLTKRFTKFIGTEFSTDSFLHGGQVAQKLKASLPGSIAGGASITLR